MVRHRFADSPKPAAAGVGAKALGGGNSEPLVVGHLASTAATGAVALFCCLAIALVLGAPLSAASGGIAAPLLYELFAPVCHQMAERSFHLAGHPLAVCHRCFGYYVGFTLGLVVLPLLPPARDWLLDEPKRILLFLAPTVIDWLLPMNTPASRFLTGVLGAAPVAVLAWAAVGQVVQKMPRNLTSENP